MIGGGGGERGLGAPRQAPQPSRRRRPRSPVARLGLRGVLGPAAARRAALLIALSPALFVNAALWGQFDALLSLCVARRRDRAPARSPGSGRGRRWAPGWRRSCSRWSRCPWRWSGRGGDRAPRGVAALVAAAVAVMGALWLPYAIAGAGAPVAAAYGGAVDYYPFRTVEAYNGWYLLDRFDIFVRGMASRDARLDTRAAFGPVTFRHLGLAALAAYTAGLAGAVVAPPVARRPCAWALAVQFFAFFMLPTQMHQRYLLPAATLAALVAPLSSRGMGLFVLLTAAATLNQGLDLGRAVLEQALVVDPAAVADPPAWRSAIRHRGDRGGGGERRALRSG